MVESRLSSVSLVIPVRNEADTVVTLINSIAQQTYQPDEIVLVDGGSTDETVKMARELTKSDSRYRIVEAGDATPGRGRNVGVHNAKSEWIAFTDAGIRLERDWLENLISVALEHKEIDVVYGNYEPEKDSFFEKCAALAYVSPKTIKNGLRWRGPSIASALMKKKVWKSVGGFPDLRAAEDLMFMEEIEKQGFKIEYAPRAVIWWKLRPTLASTFKKFVLYSKHNVWAKRERFWHYGVLRQYAVVLPFVLLAVFHSFWWWILPVIWLILRTAKNIWTKREDHNLFWLLNPIQFVYVAIIILTIDSATFVGWAQALLKSPAAKNLAAPKSSHIQ